MLFLVVLFRFLEVLKLVLKQEKWDDHFRGVLFFPPCFSCYISLREMFCSSLGGGGGGGAGEHIVVESALDSLVSCIIHVCVCVLCIT